MPAAPPPSTADGNVLGRDASRFVVLFGPEDGSRPTMEHASIGIWQPLSVTRSAGAERVDAMTLRYDLDLAQQRIEFEELGATAGRFVEVRRLNRDGTSAEVIGAGRIAIDRERIARDVEEVTVIVRFDGLMIGGPVLGYPVWRPDDLAASGRDLCTIHRDIVFNPEIDDRIEGNLSSVVTNEDDDDAVQIGVFVDPESLRTAAARAWSGEERQLWSLARAVHFLCWWLNPEETYVTNPELEELENAFADFDDDQLRNTVIPMETRDLGRALDLLLMPLGYWWCLDHPLDTDDPEGASLTTFFFFQRGKGVEREVWMQGPGERMHRDLTELSEFALDTNLIEMANVVSGFADLPLVEGTFPLIPAWSVEQEEIPGTPVVLDAFKRKDLTPEIENVGRKWVVGEAGDYVGLRADAEYDEPLDLTPLIGEHAPRRRKLERCISHVPEGDGEEGFESLRYLLEWTDQEDPGPGDWEPLIGINTTYAVLEKEMGIYFTGDLPPSQLWDILHPGEGEPRIPKLRITACIRGDRRIFGNAERRDASPNADEIPLVLDLSRKFADRRRPDAGELTSRFVVSDPAVAADEYDPTDDIQAYCERVRDLFDGALLETSITLFGADFSAYRVGNLISRVRGRELELNATVIGESEVTRYPQVIGVNYSLDGKQAMELLTETWRNESLV